MDPLSHGLVGSLIPLSFAKKSQHKQAGIIGFGSALLADLDTLISSSNDPLLNLEYHRHFTHALAFIPVGGLVGAMLFWLVFKNKLSFWQIYLWAVIGYGTAGLLDACTTYGTRIFLPFLSEKISFNLISIIDPIFTLTLLLALFLAFKRNQVKPARLGMLFMAFYLSLGGIQKERSKQMVLEVAEQRGHQITSLTVKPTMANLLVWRTIYLNGETYHVDAMRPAFFSQEQVFPGGQVSSFKMLRDLPQVPGESTLARDISRFKDFSQGHLAFAPGNNKIIGDVRYSMLPNGLAPLWGIRIDPFQPGAPAIFENYRKRDRGLGQRYLNMIFGTN